MPNRYLNNRGEDVQCTATNRCMSPIFSPTTAGLFGKVIARYVLLLTMLTLPAFGATLWYNGDWNTNTTFQNCQSCRFGDGWIYEDFDVPTGGWTLTGVFSNNFFEPGASPAFVFWEIRSGVSAGSGGMVIGNGTVPPSVAPTGRLLFGNIEEQVLAGGLALSLSPGRYWLAVVPGATPSGTDPSVSGTIGANCVGSPCATDGNAFFYSAANPSFQFYPVSSIFSTQTEYSFGVVGTLGTGGTSGGPAPEPGGLIPLALASLAVWFQFRNSKRPGLS